MSTTNIKTTSIRIDTVLKDRISKVAKSKKTKTVKILREALESYLNHQELLQKVDKLDKIRKEIDKLENWTVEEEIKHLEASRKDKTRRFKLD